MEMLTQAQHGAISVPGGSLGISPSACLRFSGPSTSSEGLAAAGTWYVLDVRPDMTVWPLEPAWSNPAYQGFGRPRKPKLLREQRLTVEGRSLSPPEGAWQEVTVAEGTQGPRTYMFSAQRVRVTRKRKPGEVVWAVYRRNLDGSEPR